MESVPDSIPAPVNHIRHAINLRYIRHDWSRDVMHLSAFHSIYDHTKVSCISFSNWVSWVEERRKWVKEGGGGGGVGTVWVWESGWGVLEHLTLWL